MAAVCAYCDRFQLGEFTGTVFCNEDCEAAYTRIRAAAEAETVAAIVALVDRLTSFEVNACTHHAESLKATHSKDRVPLHRMHECAAKQSLALGSIIKGAILSGDWKPSTSGCVGDST